MIIAKVVQKFNIKEQPKDAAYWRNRPYSERLEALEQIRREYHQWKYGAEPRLQRVYRIVKRRFPECKVESPKWHFPKK
jgi:hypothetical protein